MKTWPEWKAIAAHYGDNKAKRSGCYLMDHIDGGLAILAYLGASLETKKAFCLHPLMQEDAQFAKFFETNTTEFDQKAVMLAVEYRSVANAYLSTRTVESLDEIRLSPLPEIQQMLIADKVQNFKDFLKYHDGKHERSAELNMYFRNWLDKLNCWETFEKFKVELDF